MGLDFRHVAAVSLALAVCCSLAIAADILAGRRQSMAIMNVVWPVTALYAGPLALAAYFLWARPAPGPRRANVGKRPFWQSVILGAMHCGGGCTLGDILSETLLVAWIPFTLFGSPVFASWLLDYAAAFVFGIVFQYCAIVPMRRMSPGGGLVAALKADTLSLTAWQVGMYGWMAVTTFILFHHRLEKGDPRFWFMMQVAMLVGLATAYPVNWWLLRSGIKEAM